LISKHSSYRSEGYISEHQLAGAVRLVKIAPVFHYENAALSQSNVDFARYISAKRPPAWLHTKPLELNLTAPQRMISDVRSRICMDLEKVNLWKRRDKALASA
jgi:hypothetical protein